MAPPPPPVEFAGNGGGPDIAVHGGLHSAAAKEEDEYDLETTV